MTRFIDKYAETRKALNLYQAVEPQVKLVGTSIVMAEGLEQFLKDNQPPEDTISLNEMPGFFARKSHGSAGDTQANVQLTKKLQAFNPKHKTPFEFAQWVFDITGVSKSCLTQFDRNRVGIGFVQMSGRYMDRSESGFVYSAYSHHTEEEAIEFWKQDEEYYKTTVEKYNAARIRNQTRQDARKNLPLAQATGTYVYMNSSSLQQFFNERLRPAAEWEIRRMAQMMLDIVYSIAPAHFQDAKDILGETLS